MEITGFALAVDFINAIDNATENQVIFRYDDIAGYGIIQNEGLCQYQ